MRPELIKLEMDTVVPEEPENGSRKKWIIESKEAILSELIDVLDPAFKIGNRNKLLLDFVNREKKASTGIGHGYAIPHIRSMQAKEFMIGFARSSEGFCFCPDSEEKIHMFFIMAAPPYDDNLYLKVFKALAEMLQYEDFRNQLMTAESPGEIIRAIRAQE